MESRSGWQKSNIKMRVASPTARRKPKTRDNVQETETHSGLERSREVPTKTESRSGWQRTNIKRRVASPTTRRGPKSRDNAQETETHSGLGRSREVPTKTESRSGWQRTNIKRRVARPTTRRKPKSRDHVQETEIHSGLERSREVPTKTESRSGWQRTNIKMRVARPTTWRSESRDHVEETDTPSASEISREVPTKKESRSAWQRANVKMRVARPTTWREPKSRDHVQETETHSGLESSREVPTKTESRSGWQRANIKMRVTRLTTWRRPKSRDSAQETEIPCDLERSEGVPTKMLGRKAWQKANVKMQIIKTKAKIHSPLIQEGDEGKSKFVLANLEHYTVHPNLIQYYEPLKVTEPHKLLGGNQKIKRFMSRVTEFDQNKTLLIMTNNPPPSPVNWQGKDKPPCYFSKELLVKPQEQQKITTHAGLPLMKKKLKTEPRTPFPVAILEDAIPKREQWYRFSTNADFKGEAKFSKFHALKKQQEKYPELSFVPDFRSAAREARSRRKISVVTWEPLTLATLLEEKPTLTVPLPGESPFRYGRAPQWFINTTAVPD